jgi:hypothetical protein
MCKYDNIRSFSFYRLCVKNKTFRLDLGNYPPNNKKAPPGNRQGRIGSVYIFPSLRKKMFVVPRENLPYIYQTPLIIHFPGL